ncbi:hypothetical protein HanRHA438_Chr08g0352871 [Helianthus annuus]|nr:hypothetical protein HanRHA438_Chr08g0352871 [Helianthus annuus]
MDHISIHLVGSWVMSSQIPRRLNSMTNIQNPPQEVAYLFFNPMTSAPSQSQHIQKKKKKKKTLIPNK